MKKFKGLMTSLTCEYATPQWLYDELNKEFNFLLDVCANKDNAKCYKFYTEKDDALNQSWVKPCWMNPPYGREIRKWVKKAWEESWYVCSGGRVVCLLPARTDTKWWHDYVMKADEIRFIKGRLKFNDSKNSAPFPSCIVIFGRKQ